MNDQTLPYAVPVNQQNPSMSRQIFGLIVRTVGLLLAVYGLYNFVIAVTATIGVSYEGAPTAYVVYSVFWLGVGAALLRCEWLLRLAYGREG